MTTLITLVLPIGGDAGPFNLYSNVGGYAIPFETNVSASALQAGYTTSLVPDGTTIIRVTSVGVCTNSIDITVGLIPTTTTTSSSSSSTSTTTSTAVPTTTTTSSSSTSTSTSTSTTSTSSSTTTTTTTVACGCYEWNVIYGVIDVAQSPPVTVAYINCVGEIVERPSYVANEATICVQASTIPVIYRADEPAGLVDSSVTITSTCCGTPPITTTTTTTAPVQNINYRVTACPNAGIYAGLSYNFPKNGTTHSIGEVVQFIIPGDVDGLIRCGTITSITWPNNAIDASLFGVNIYDCDDTVHCNV